MTNLHKPTPQEQARLDSIRRQWQQKKKIEDHMAPIKNKIAVYSGKGGVGKTTVSVNLAVSLASRGSKTGIFDADVDCPNIVEAMHATEGPKYTEETFLPSEMWGVKILSMGFFQENPEDAIIFRGPMIHNSITQFLEGTDWGELDYLFTDLPPGTSDAALTIMQSMPVDGFVVVTAPQNLARLDAKRSINMIRKMNIPILGVVENFTGDIFGEGGGEEISKDMGVPYLGSLSMSADYRDQSKPTVLSSNIVSAEYNIIVDNLIANIGST
jgi:ATP-binding protein involved in chromosome partitioning